MPHQVIGHRLFQLSAVVGQSVVSGGRFPGSGVSPDAWPTAGLDSTTGQCRATQMPHRAHPTHPKCQGWISAVFFRPCRAIAGNPVNRIEACPQGGNPPARFRPSLEGFRTCSGDVLVMKI